MADYGVREVVDRAWRRRLAAGGWETIRLVRVFASEDDAPGERWEVRYTGGKPATSEHPNQSCALAEISRLIGDAWMEMPVARRR